MLQNSRNDGQSVQGNDGLPYYQLRSWHWTLHMDRVLWSWVLFFLTSGDGNSILPSGQKFYKCLWFLFHSHTSQLLYQEILLALPSNYISSFHIPDHSHPSLNHYHYCNRPLWSPCCFSCPWLSTHNWGAKNPLKHKLESPLVVQWLRSCVPSAGAQVQSLIRELDPERCK